MMFEKEYSINEINDLIPQLEVIISQYRTRYDSLIVLRQDNKTLNDTNSTKLIKSLPVFQFVDDDINELIQEKQTLIEISLMMLKRAIDELSSMDINIHDPYEGELDFLMDAEKKFYYSWKYGEKNIGHWHQESTPFSTRQRLTSSSNDE